MNPKMRMLNRGKASLNGVGPSVGVRGGFMLNGPDVPALVSIDGKQGIESRVAGVLDPSGDVLTAADGAMPVGARVKAALRAAAPVAVGALGFMGRGSLLHRAAFGAVGYVGSRILGRAVLK